MLVTLELLPKTVRRANPDLSLIEARALLNTGHAEQTASCLVCGRAVESGQSVVRIHGLTVHLKCAGYRRARTRR